MIKEGELNPRTLNTLALARRRNNTLPAFLKNGVYRSESRLLRTMRDGLFRLIFREIIIEGAANWESAVDSIKGGEKYILTCNHTTDADTAAFERAVDLASKTLGTKPRLTWVAGLKMDERNGTRIFAESVNRVYVPTPQDLTNINKARKDPHLGLSDKEKLDFYYKKIHEFGKESFREAKLRLDNGDVLCLFPEATRSRTGLINFDIDDIAKVMVANLFHRLGDIQIIPSAVSGLHSFFPPENNERIISSFILGGLRLRQIRPKIVFGRPYSFSDLINETASKRWNIAMARIAQLNPENIDPKDTSLITSLIADYSY